MPQQPYQDLPLKQYFSQFFGGQQTQEEPQKIDDWGSPDLLNVRPVGKGAYGPRNGITRLGNDITGAGGRTGIWNFAKGTTETLVSPRGTIIEFLDQADNTWKTIPGATGYTDGAKFGFANDNKYLYFCNAVEDFAIWDGNNFSAVAVTAATSDVLTATAHGMVGGEIITFATSGTLPAGITAGTKYFVLFVDADTFKISTTYGGTQVDITDTGSGTHSYSSSIKTYSSAPKGNIFEFYNNRLYVAGITGQPVTLQYSVINDGTKPSYDFAGSGSGNYTAPDGGDYFTALRVFTRTDGTKVLYIFKKSRKTYVLSFDSSGNLSVLEDKKDTGAVNQKSTIILENDIIYIDNGNNIANLGFRENIQNQIRTDSTTTGLDRTTSAIDFTNACGVYWKKRRMALYSGKDYGSENNDFVLAYFYDFKSWWRWKGINANEFAIYLDEVVWASSTDLNVYKYDESKFDDNDGAIQSYRATKDVEYMDRNQILLSDRYKKARFVTVRGYISPGAVFDEATNDDKKMYIHIVYDGDNEQKISQSFSGNDDDITTQNFSVYFGSNIFGSQAFGGSALSPTAFPLREFFAVVSLDYYSNFRIRVIPEIQGAGVPYLVTHIAIWSELTPEEQWADGNKI